MSTASSDQAARLRAIVEQSLPRAIRTVVPGASAPASTPVPAEASAAPGARVAAGPIIAIASGKGGVGKSTLALNLAIALAQQHHEVILLDGDVGLANLDLLCGVSPMRHLGHVLAGKEKLRDVFVHVAPRCRLIPGGSAVAGLLDMDERSLERLARVIEASGERADRVIIDCGAGVDRGVTRLIRAAHDCLVVTTPEPTALADAYALIKSLATDPGAPPPGLWLVVNQARSAREAREVYERLAATSAKFLRIAVGFAGSLRCDPAVGDAVRRRRPVLLAHPSSDVARDVRSLSGLLSQNLRNVDDRSGEALGGFLDRLSGAIGMKRSYFRGLAHGA